MLWGHREIGQMDRAFGGAPDHRLVALDPLVANDPAPSGGLADAANEKAHLPPYQ
jgi:hypothetical protein